MAKRSNVVVPVTYRFELEVYEKFEQAYDDLKEKGYSISKNKFFNLLINKGLDAKFEESELNQ